MLKAAFSLLRIVVGLASLGVLTLCLLAIAVFIFFTAIGNAFAPLAQLPRFIAHGLQDPGPNLHHTYLYLLPYTLLAVLFLAFLLSTLSIHRPIFYHAIAVAATSAAVWTLIANPINPGIFWPILALWFTWYATILFTTPSSADNRNQP
jgi:hypothetical protein